jgi:hypothetical protein
MIESVPPLELHCPFNICSAVGNAAASTAKHAAVSAANAVLASFASWVVGGATWLVDQAIAFLKQTTNIDIRYAWFARREGAMTQVALLVVLPMVLAATIGAIIRQDTKRLVRIYGVGIPLAGTATVAAIALASEAIAVVDAMCDAITSHTKAYEPFTNIDGDMTHHGMPLIVEILIGSVVLLAGLVLWLELILRSIVVDIAVFFLPLGLAAVVWPATAQITKRFVEVLVAVIGSKFVIVATLTLAAALAEHAGSGAADAVKATAVLLLAAFAPFALLRLIPLVEVAAIAHLEGMSRRPIRAGAGAASMASGGARSAGGLLLSRAGGGVGGDVTSGDIPWRAGDFDLDNLPASAGGGSAAGGSPGGGLGSTGGASGGTSGGGSSGGGSSGGGSPGGGSKGGGGPTGPSPAVTPAPAGGSPPEGAEHGSSRASGSGSVGAGGGMPDPADLPGPLPVLGAPPSIPPERDGSSDG